eukprot:jgi/Ulvmu1/10582/UM065_0036.1
MYHRALAARASRRKPGRDLTDAERLEVRQAFDLFDVEGSGSIYYRELKTCLRALGFPCKKQDVLTMLRHAELDQSEAISYNDFEKLMKAQYLGRTFDELVDRAFKVFDAEGRGYITVKGLKRVTREVGHEIGDDELNEMIHMFDMNGDGMIDKKEFKRIMRVHDSSKHEDDSDEEQIWSK